MRVPRSLVAALVLGAGATACSSSSGNGSCTTVVADAGGNRSVSKRSVVNLSALQSTSTDGAPLQFAWALTTKPSASGAVLAATAGPFTSFIPDVEGTYVVTLAATGTCTAQDHVQVFVTNTPPQANATASPSGTVPVRSPVALSGASSWDPDGDPLTFAWTLSVPVGSASALDSSTASAPSFTPDVPGDYRATLVVSDGSAPSAPATTSVTAADLPPVASLASAALVATVGDAVAIDATASADPDHDVLSFAWTLVSQPATSSASLADPAAAVAQLTPDVEGTYVTRVTVSDSQASATADATVTVYARIAMLGYRPVDAEYSRALDRVVMVAAAPDELHVYDAIGAADVSVALPLAPTCVGVSPDGDHAIVGHAGFVSYVDLRAGTLLGTFAVSADAADVILSDPMTVAGARTTRFAYVYPQRDQWSNLHVVDLGTGVETLASDLVYAGGRFKPQPGTNHVFLVELGLSPQQLYRYDLDLSTGAIAYAAQSPYWGDYGMGSDFWLSDDGSQILFTSGNRFRPADMTYGGTLGFPIRWAHAPKAPSAAAGSWIVQPATSPWAYPPDTTSDQSFRIVDSTYLAETARVDHPRYVRGGVAYPVHGRYVFFDDAGTKRIAIVQVDPAASLLNDYGVVVR